MEMDRFTQARQEGCADLAAFERSGRSVPCLSREWPKHLSFGFAQRQIEIILGAAAALRRSRQLARGVGRCLRGVVILGGCIAGALAVAAPQELTERVDPKNAQAIVAHAAERTMRWSGPRSGPLAPAGKAIAVVAEDLRNGGVLGVAQGVREACGRVGWTVKVFNAEGSREGRAKAFAQALAMSPDGLVLAGADAWDSREELMPFARRGTPVVGWHAGPHPGPIDGTAVAMNITTDPLQVARITAMAAVAESGGHAGVVIFTDSNHRIAMAKAQAMVEVIRACRGCTLLELRDLPISDSARLMPGATRELLHRHGARWTHALAINDVYFDHAVPTLIAQNSSEPAPRLLSAGDGSSPAFQRIQAHAFQVGTVAEPLSMQGWQAVDELNRLFAGQAVSGFVAPVHLVTPDNVAFDGGEQLRYDPDNGYRDIYARIWKH